MRKISITFISLDEYMMLSKIKFRIITKLKFFILCHGQLLIELLYGVSE